MVASLLALAALLGQAQVPAPAGGAPGAPTAAVPRRPALPAAPAAVPAPAQEPAGHADDPVEARRAAIASDMVRLGGDLRRALEKSDLDALLARVPEDGLRCGTRLVPRAKVARDLRSPRSWLRGVLLGGPGYAPPKGVAPSLRALFESSPEVAVLVAFAQDERVGPVGRPCIDFRARALGTPGAPMCFESRGGRWLFTQSLYPCQ
jgi:hypothetical protein